VPALLAHERADFQAAVAAQWALRAAQRPPGAGACVWRMAKRAETRSRGQPPPPAHAGSTAVIALQRASQHMLAAVVQQYVVGLRSAACGSAGRWGPRARLAPMQHPSHAHAHQTGLHHSAQPGIGPDPRGRGGHV
jgi:hypothetical protein